MTNEELVELIRSGKREYEADLYQQNMPLIKKIATKFSYNADEPLEDLMQQAYFGLIEAVNRYDPGKGCLFVTYAYQWIKQELRRYISTCGRAIRISEHTRYLYYEYRKFEEYVLKFRGREPTVQEYARVLDVPERTVLQLQQTIYDTSVSSLDVPLGEDSEETIADITADRNQNVESCIDRMHEKQVHDELHEEIARLDPQQQTLIRMRMNGLTVIQTGEAMGITSEQARTLECKAMRELRRSRKIVQIGRDAGIVTW